MRNKKPTSNASSLALGPNAEHSSREGEHTVYTSPLEVARNVRRCVEVASESIFMYPSVYRVKFYVPYDIRMKLHVPLDLRVKFLVLFGF
jgi:hypothetical protein